MLTWTAHKNTKAKSGNSNPPHTASEKIQLAPALKLQKTPPKSQKNLWRVKK